MMTAAKNVNAQRLGLVVVSYFLDEAGRKFDLELLRTSVKIVGQWIPVKVVSRYMLMNNSGWKPIIDAAVDFSSAAFRIRTRSITGELLLLQVLRVGLAEGSLCALIAP